MLQYDGVQWLAVVVAAVAGFGLGALWYSPLLFGGRWLELTGRSEEELGNPAPAMGVGFLMTLVSALVLALLIGSLEMTTLSGGALAGAVVGFGLVATAFATNYAFHRLSLRLWMIDGGYFALYMVLMGAVLGAWG